MKCVWKVLNTRNYLPEPFLCQIKIITPLISGANTLFYPWSCQIFSTTSQCQVRSSCAIVVFCNFFHESFVTYDWYKNFDTMSGGIVQNPFIFANLFSNESQEGATWSYFFQLTKFFDTFFGQKCPYVCIVEILSCHYYQLAYGLMPIHVFCHQSVACEVTHANIKTKKLRLVSNS